MRGAIRCVVTMVPFFLGSLGPAFLGSLGPASAADRDDASAPPPAPVRPVVDAYWGREIVDDYQYLERVDDPEVVAWADGQHAHTRAWLDAYPGRDELATRVHELSHGESASHGSMRFVAGQLFAIEHQPPKQQRFLVVLESPGDLETERVVVDPNVIDPSGRTAIDFYVPSHDGRLVAVSLSKDGTEDGTLHVYEVATGRVLDDVIPRVNGGTAGGDVAWTAESDGFYYSRYPYPGERSEEDLHFYQQIWFHRLGTPLADDHYVLGESFPRIAEIELETSDDGRHVLAEVSNGDGGEYEFWLKSPGHDWTRIARFEDWVQKAAFGADGALYLLSRLDAPCKRVLRIAPGSTDLAAAVVVVPESREVVTDFVVGATRIYVATMYGGPMQLQAYRLDGGAAGRVELGEYSSVTGLVRLDGDHLLLRRETYTTPPAWFDYEPEMERPRPTALATTSPADFANCEVWRIFAPADDGTQVPINLIMRRDTVLDGSAPLILYAYGSYGNSQRPSFSANRLLWIEQGGIYAIACVRGGGEYGDAWHRAANLENKRVSMDDLGACARYLARERYTSADRLVIEGGSAGGLLVFGTMAHYPDRMAVVVARVGIGDALRTELSPNGEFNITEFGTVKNPRQFPGMLAASPYHQIRNGVQYPAVIATTGMNDPRVEPWQSFKMAARLQATGSKHPVLLRVSKDTGHGGSSSLSAKEAERVDIYTFILKQLGMEYRPPSRRESSD